MEIIDCNGLACPMPVIKTKKYFDLEESKEAIVIVDNEVAKNNILRLAKGINLNSSYIEEDGIYKIQLSKGLIEKAIENKSNIENEKSGLSILGGQGGS